MADTLRADLRADVERAMRSSSDFASARTDRASMTALEYLRQTVEKLAQRVQAAEARAERAEVIVSVARFYVFACRERDALYVPNRAGPDYRAARDRACDREDELFGAVAFDRDAVRADHQEGK
jgi:hypothetical protein